MEDRGSSTMRLRREAAVFLALVVTVLITEQVGKALVPVGAIALFARLRLRSVLVVGTSASVITLMAGFVFVGSPPGSKRKSEPMPRLHSIQGAGRTADSRVIGERPTAPVRRKVRGTEN